MKWKLKKIILKFEVIEEFEAIPNFKNKVYIRKSCTFKEFLKLIFKGLK